MNYLAHVFLAGPEPAAVAGALLGDFVKGNKVETYPPAVRAAILLHRAVDRYTDAHTLVQASRQLISPARRRFAGILVDVFYDHFLARHWSRFSAEALPAFTARVYGALSSHAFPRPERFERMLPRMRADDWLASYVDPIAIDRAIDGIARRFSRPTNLFGGGEELRHGYRSFEANFLAFFPQLTANIPALVACCTARADARRMLAS